MDPFGSPPQSPTASPCSSRPSSPEPAPNPSCSQKPDSDLLVRKIRRRLRAKELSKIKRRREREAEGEAVNLSRKVRKRVRAKEAAQESKVKRRGERQAAEDPQPSLNYGKHLEGVSKVPSNLDGGGSLRAVSTGYLGVRTEDGRSNYRLDDLVGPESKFNFKVIKWVQG